MPFSLKIDENLDCAFVKWSGGFSHDDSRIFHRETADNARYRQCSKRLHDVRHVNFDVPTSEVDSAARTWAPEGAQQIECKSAILASSSLSFGVMRMFSAMYERPGMTLNVIRDLEEAKEWLGIPADIGDPFEEMTSD